MDGEEEELKGVEGWFARFTSCLYRIERVTGCSIVLVLELVRRHFGSK